MRLRLLLLSSFLPAIAFSAPDAQTLMEENHQATLLKGSSVEATFELVSQSGQTRVRKVISKTRLQENGTDNSRWTRFEFPAEARGMATLLIEHSGKDDDLWIYLPTMKKTRRIIADGQRDSFMGTVLSYADVLGHAPAEWRHTLIGEGQSEGRKCWRVSSTPRDDTIRKQSGYSKRESCLAKDNSATLRMDTWDESDRPLKTITNRQIRTVDGQAGAWIAYETEAVDLQSGYRTRITIDKFRFMASPAKADFTPGALTQDD